MARGAGIVGRDTELSALEARLERLAAGHGGLIWIEAEAGVGKTALVDAALERARGLGVTALRGVGDEMTQPFPLRVIADCLGVSGRSKDPASAEIAALLRGHAGGTGAADPILAAGERMLDLVDRLCADAPLLLVAEDLHWADEPSLRLWYRMARAVDQIPLLLVGVARPIPRRAPVERLRTLVREQAGHVMALEPLDATAVALLAQRMTGGVPGPRLRGELARADGNALFVRELVDALVDDGLVDVVGGTAEFHGADGATPQSLSAAIVHRLGFLSDRTLRVLRIAALTGCEFEAGWLAAAAGESVTDLAGTLTEAVDGAVVVDAGERFAFRHGLIQQALVGQIPRGLLRTLRGHVITVLMDLGGAIDAVAPHLLAAPGLFDDRVLDWLSRVDLAELLTVPQVSQRLLTSALDLVAETDPRREPLAVRLVSVRYLSGHDDEVIGAATAMAASTAHPETAARMWVLAARAAGRSGHIDQALDTLRVALADTRVPPVWRARLETWSAVVLAQSGRVEESRAAARRAMSEARESGDALSVGYAYHAASVGSTDWQEIVDHLDHGIAVLGGDPESGDLRMLMTANLLDRLLEMGDLDRLKDELPRALRLAERMGTARAVLIQAVAPEEAFRHGDWDTALMHVDAIDPEFRAVPEHVYLHGLTALIALHRGDRDRSAVHMAAIDAVSADEDAFYLTGSHYITVALVLRAEVEGDPAHALELAAAWLESPPGPMRMFRADVAPDLVRLALAAGDRATALAAVAAAREIAEEFRLGYLWANLHLCEARLHDDAGGLLAAAAEYRDLGLPLESAAAQEAAAVRLAETGDATGARSALTGAVRGYAGLGAEWDIRRADARLRAYGVRRGPRSLHRRASTGWQALTPSEVRIAHLVAAGRSNPDIAAELVLSRYTVQTHVSHILTKLALRSRVELVRAAAGSG
jgi:DNA-binding CsgD family transcriptional regulator